MRLPTRSRQARFDRPWPRSRRRPHRRNLTLQLARDILVSAMLPCDRDAGLPITLSLEERTRGELTAGIEPA